MLLQCLTHSGFLLLLVSKAFKQVELLILIVRVLAAAVSAGKEREAQKEAERQKKKAELSAPIDLEAARQQRRRVSPGTALAPMVVSPGAAAPAQRPEVSPSVATETRSAAKSIEAIAAKGIEVAQDIVAHVTGAVAIAAVAVEAPREVFRPPPETPMSATMEASVDATVSPDDAPPAQSRDAR